VASALAGSSRLDPERIPVTFVQSPRALASTLAEHVLRDGTVSMNALSADPVAALEDDPAVRIVWVEPADLPDGCSIAAACDKSANPARLLISRDASTGRQRFSVLHEYAHLLRDLVPAVLEVLFAAAEAGAALEEDICDEFASLVLLPDTLLDRALGTSITARSVLSLIATAPASAEACAVAAARKLSAPGYVMLLSPDGTARFTAHNGDLYHIRRDTLQTGLLVRAAAGQTVRGREQVRYGTGNLGRQMFVDAVTENGRSVAVLVTDSPPWGGFTLGYKPGPEGSNGYCDGCGDEFTTFDPACGGCGQPPCPRCRHCACEANPGIAGERKCGRCYLTGSAKLFVMPVS
jgi:hypothetical protein